MNVDDLVYVPRATYDRLCEIVRCWDAWLLTGKQDDELRQVAARMTAEFCGTEAGARIEGSLGSGGGPTGGVVSGDSSTPRPRRSNRTQAETTNNG